MSMIKKIALFILIAFAIHPIVAQNNNRGKAILTVRDFLKTGEKANTPEDHLVQLFNDDKTVPVTYLISLKPKGFVVVSKANNIFSVVAYSFENNFECNKRDEKPIALSLLKEACFVNKQDAEHIGEVRTVKNTNVIYGPYVHTMWGQVNCHDNNGNLINVTNIYTPNHYAVGCVAVSQATIMHHYLWPPKGVGSYTHIDNSGSSKGTYTVDFGETEYRWDLMRERYRAKPSTTEQREAAGELAYDAAIALRMNFEPNGSTSNVNRIPIALANYFRFTALYRSRSSSTFWSLIDSNMVYKKPAVLAVENSSGGGHSVVCDGLQIDENSNYFYHLNMGWWGASNGWYKIRGSFDAGGYNTIIGAAMNIIPEPMIITPVIASDSIEFDLTWRYPANAEAEAFQVQKRVNNGNWITISSDISDTSLHILVDPTKDYKFRVRAKTNGKWYQNSWSTVTHLVRSYVGTEELEPNTVYCYPNPFDSELTVQVTDAAESIVVFDEIGKAIFKTGKINNDKVMMNTLRWKSGLYFIHVKSNKRNFIIKAIKK